MKDDNRTKGGKFEQELSHILAENGFWAHVLQQNKAGQPADIIAVRGRFHTLIDCKVCSGTEFKFSRIEDNQRSAMHMFMTKAKDMCYFALKFPDGKICMAPITTLESLELLGKKSIPEKIAGEKLMDLQQWLSATEVWAEDT